MSESKQAEHHYSLSIQYRLYRKACQQLEVLPIQKILEVGGTGAFAHCPMETLCRHYRGFAFSEVGVRTARARTGCHDCFFVGDARVAKSHEQPYDTIVCLEVLEHIERDLDVVAN